MNGLTELLDGIGSPRILVVGDLMLDRYTWGDATRVSPEAPVLVLRADLDEVRLGGAASVAALLRGLNAEVSLAGVLGEDADGHVVRRLLDETGVEAGLVMPDDTRPTTCKQRIVGRAAGRHPHQIVRVDHEDARTLSDDLGLRFSAAVAARVTDYQAVLVSDYGKGVCSRTVLGPVLRAARRAAIPILIDPARDADFRNYRNASLIKPNRAEAQAASGLTIDSPADALRAAETIRRHTNAEAVLVTLESDGMALVTSAGEEHLLATRARAVYDVTGAGDMALATLGLARAAGTGWHEAAQLAVAAAGLEVERLGVSPISGAELRASLDDAGDRRVGIAHQKPRKLVTLPDLADLVNERRAAGRTIVLANGVFDLLHVGHVRCLEEAADQGEILIVAVNSDASARRLKGPGRPVVCARRRAQLIASLACVDHVAVFDDDTPERLLSIVRPDVLVKGGDYAADEVVGREFVESYGGRVHLAGHVRGASTTQTVKAIAGGRQCRRCSCSARRSCTASQASTADP
ncbi:MAG TPA: bifunctional heptose 7-phosphate kinase/heptose 1-phosphate adenyltransferase [Pirellulales bacterium]|nr:bifunctional heptose 7-phosphate kinase/heptose 1-phosphate adenyltransferase [Pirellulales bacterium]